MTCRVENDQTYIQAYNAENRISEVQAVTGTCDTPGDITSIWSFTYDGDGVKVMQVYESGSTTLTTCYYIGGAYEATTDGTTETIKKYYSLSGITVAMHDGTQLLYFLTDHLGSVVAITDASGMLLNEQRYMPFGQVRTDIGTPVTQTDFGYTFQRNLPDIGLMDYKARLYDANIGRFIQADSIVPGASRPEAWNRFSNVSNNPILANDPSGHGSCRNFNGGQGCISNWRTEDKHEGGFAPIIKRDALIEQRRKLRTSSLTGTDTVDVIICGFGTDDSCENGTPVEGYADPNSGSGDEVPLQDFIVWSEENGHATLIFSTDPNDPSKWKQEVAEQIAEYIRSHPGTTFNIIGHCGGADAALIAVGLANYSQDIASVILFDVPPKNWSRRSVRIGPNRRHNQWQDRRAILQSRSS
jgi:RHS repeat-associated protein